MLRSQDVETIPDQDFGKRVSVFFSSAAALILTFATATQALACETDLLPQSDAVGISAQEELPTIAFCELVKHPELYFDKRVRLSARLELTEEAQYLSDDKCLLSHDEQIGVGYASTSEMERDLHNNELTRIRSIEYGSRANITAVGVLRNSSMRAFAWYHYRFEIIRFEEISHVIVPYEGTLQAGLTYRAVVRGEKRTGLSLAKPLRIPEYYAVRIEWTNLSSFPTLKRLRATQSERQIVFSVISDQSKQMTEHRWNRTVLCKVISVE